MREDQEQTVVCIRLKNDLYEKLKLIGEENGLKLVPFMRVILTQFLNTYGEQGIDQKRGQHSSHISPVGRALSGLGERFFKIAKAQG